MFLHGVNDFHISNGDTLKNPSFIEHGKLKTFDIVLANPPYSISQWDRGAFGTDKYGRNFLGTPSQGIADFAFLQHILKSMDPLNGRCAVLLPRGILSRYSEIDMRKKLVELDLVDCIIGIGKGLFYNSPMEACVLIGRSVKPPERKGKIQIINAGEMIYREGTQSYIGDDDIERITEAYRNYRNVDGFCQIIDKDKVLENNGSLSVSLYVKNSLKDVFLEHMDTSPEECLKRWKAYSDAFHRKYEELKGMME